VAVHEAGHAVAAWCCTAVRSVRVDIGEGEGWTRWKTVTIERQDDWTSLVISLAGIAAENYVFGSFHAHESQLDLLKALKLARALTRSGRTAAEKPANDLVPFGRIFVETIGNEEQCALQSGYSEAKRLVVSHGERYFRLVSLILMCPALSERQLEVALGPRTAVALLNRIGASVFLCPRRGG
jgi:ATP-dependent Zn protease